MLAVAPAAAPASYAQRVAELVDLKVSVARGLDLERRRFVPAPSDPLFGYARCPARGCLNVTEHTATSLCRAVSIATAAGSEPPTAAPGPLPGRGDADAQRGSRAAVPGLPHPGA